MDIKVTFDNITVKEDKIDTVVKILMLKGEKGDQGDGENNVIEEVQVNGTALPVSNKAVNVPVPTVDNALNSTSENPVQNKVIYNALNGKVNNSDLNNYYQTSEIDNLLNDKVNNSDLNDIYNYIDGDKVKILHNTLTLDELTQNGGGKFFFNKVFKKGFISQIRYRSHSSLTSTQNGTLYFYKKEETNYILIDAIPFTAVAVDTYIDYNKFVDTDFYIGCDIPRYIAYKSTVFTEPHNCSNISSFPNVINETNLNFNHYYEFGIDVHYSVANEINRLKQTIDASKERKYLFLGDSYSVGWTPDGDVKSWCEFCKDFLELDNVHYVTTGSGGASFGNQSGNSFTDLLNSQENDDTITDVVCCGGYNEIGMTTVNTLAGMLSFKNACNTKFPNARIHIGFIGNTKDKTQKPNISARCETYINGCAMYNMNYLNNVEFSLHRYYEDFASDGIHPNATGEEHIAWYVTQALRTGSADVIINNTSLSGSYQYFQTNVRNAITTLLHIANNTFNFNSETLPPFALTGGNAIDLFDVTNGNITGSGIYTSRGLIPNLQITYSDNTYSIIDSCQFEIVDNKFKIYPAVINSSGTNYVNKQIKTIFIRPFTHTFSSLDI